MKQIDRDTERDEGFLEAQLVWNGGLVEGRAFGFDGRSLDDDPSTLDAWIKDLEAYARYHGETDMQVYLVEHRHAVDIDGCACWLDVPDGRPYWASRETDER